MYVQLSPIRCVLASALVCTVSAFAVSAFAVSASTVSAFAVSPFAVSASDVRAFAVSPAPSQETLHLKLIASAGADAASPGQKLSLRVDVTPKPQMHVYAPGQDGYIAVQVTLDSNPAVAAAGKAKYPNPETLLIPALNEKQLVYAKPFQIVQDIAIANNAVLQKRAAAGDTLAIKGSLRYQACDDRICYLPKTVPLEWTVKLVASR